MPKQFLVGLPDHDQRYKILSLVRMLLHKYFHKGLLYFSQILGTIPLTSTSPPLLQSLAERTHGLSGSDLKELCHDAAMKPVRELFQNLEAEFGPENVEAILELEEQDLGVRAWCNSLPTKCADTFTMQAFEPRPLTIGDFDLKEFDASLGSVNENEREFRMQVKTIQIIKLVVY
jgi:SpoVK/Ycf46/Vps4 family AAA+-type ATPase